jgi:hypothetical protein
MKKKHMARLVLGMVLLASSLTGYGMESNEVIEKQKGGATQATDKLEQGECFVSKKAFRECLSYFLYGHGKFLKIDKDTQLSSEDIFKNSLKHVFEQKPGEKHHNYFETNLEKIKDSLKADYLNVCQWFLGNTEKWVGKFKDSLDDNDHLQYENYTGSNLRPLLKGEHLDDFLKFLSDKKDTDQILKNRLGNLQYTKKSVFNNINKDQCAQQLSRSVLDCLDFENKYDPIRCRFYDRIDSNHIKQSYCKVYIDITGFVKRPIGKVHFYNLKNDLEYYNTKILVMVFGKDSQDSFRVSLEDAYPWAGRDEFLKARDKAGDENPDSLAEEMENLFLEVPRTNDDKLRKFWRSLGEATIASYFRNLERYCGNRKEALDRLNAIRGYLGQTKEEYNLLEKKIDMLKEANLRQKHRHHLVRMELDQTKKALDALGDERQNLENLNSDLSQKIIVLELQSVEREKNMQDQLDLVRMQLNQTKKKRDALDNERQNLERLNGDLCEKIIVLALQSVEREKNMQDQLDLVQMELDQTKKKRDALDSESQNLERFNGDLFQRTISLETRFVEREEEMQDGLNAIKCYLHQTKEVLDTLDDEKEILENLNGDLSQENISLKSRLVEREEEMQNRLNAVLMDLDQVKKERSTLEEEKQNLEYRNICLFKDNVSLNTQLIESEKEADILDEEIEQLDGTLKTFQRKSRRNLCCLALTSIPTVMFCLRWGILEFLRAQKYYSI